MGQPMVGPNGLEDFASRQSQPASPEPAEGHPRMRSRWQELASRELTQAACLHLAEPGELTRSLPGHPSCS
eukprot:COSAG06_NODE_325_length_17475_cov_13.436982_3_plen_71_part_00